MGCRNCLPIFATRKVEDEFRYTETLVSDGAELCVDFSRRNRRVTAVTTLDREVTFNWTPKWVSFAGPRGAELIVEFTIGA